MTTSNLPTGNESWSAERIWRRRFAFLTSLLTLALIYAGGLVTSHGAGISVPDWPTTYGENMFTYPVSKWVGGIYYEHSHRLLASLVGFLILVQAFWIGSRDRRLRGVAFGALVAVIAQGILGGVTVLLGLSPTISVLHGVLGQTLFALTAYIAYNQSREREARLAEPAVCRSMDSLGRAAFIATAIVYIQLIVGAVMRHNYAGLAVPDFPLMGGSMLPVPNDAMVAAVNQMRHELMFDPVTKSQVIVNIAHRIGAAAVIAGTIGLNIVAVRAARGDRRIMRHISVFNALVLLQAGLGAFTIWSRKNPIVTSLHVVVGAALLGWSSLLVLRTRPVVSPHEGAVDTGSRDRSIASQERAGSLEVLCRACWDLSKPRLNLMVCVSAALGYFLASNGDFSLVQFILTMVGIGVAGAGASALNQFLEREYDAQMERTRQRPIPSGTITPQSAILFGLAATLGGVFLLVWSVNLLSGFIVLLTAFLYVLVYTPIKRLTWLNTPVGAIPGALPAVAGWAAASGQLSAGAFALFVVLYIWQHPHFFAIAWIYRKDYAAGGFRMLPVVEPDGESTFRLIAVFSFMLVIAAAAVPLMTGSLGALYVCGALGLGGVIFALGIAADRSRTIESARRLFHASLVYLPALLFFAVLDTLA